MKGGLIFFLAIATAFSTPAFAGGGLGKVGKVYAQSTGHIFFSIGIHNNAPGCQGGSDEFSIDLRGLGNGALYDRAYGEAQYALILAAKGLGKNVHVIGTGDCSAWGDRETVNYLYIVD